MISPTRNAVSTKEATHHVRQDPRNSSQGNLRGAGSCLRRKLGVDRFASFLLLIVSTTEATHMNTDTDGYLIFTRPGQSAFIIHYSTFEAESEHISLDSGIDCYGNVEGGYVNHTEGFGGAFTGI